MLRWLRGPRVVSRRRTPRRRFSWRERLGARLPRGRAWLAAAAAAAAIAVGAWGLARLEAHVASSAMFSGPVTVHLINAPPWLSEAALEDLRSVGRLVEGPRWLETSALRDVRDALLGSGWIAGVDRVVRRSGGVLEVACRYRQPAALVACDGRLYLVDADGRRLPGTYAASDGWTVIQGVRTPPPPVAQPWNDPALTAALNLWRLLSREPFAHQVAAINVENYGGRVDREAHHIRLQTRVDETGALGGLILWGSAPGEETEEPTAADKVRVLRANYQRHGRIDAGARWIDLASALAGTYLRPSS